MDTILLSLRLHCLSDPRSLLHHSVAQTQKAQPPTDGEDSEALASQGEIDEARIVTDAV